jgi:hypothetical protein
MGNLERTHAADSQLLALEGLEMSAPLRRWIWFGGLYVISIVAFGAVTFLVRVTLSHFK